MSKIERTLSILRKGERGEGVKISSVCFILVTVAYIAVLLSVPLNMPQKLIWFALYPVAYSEILGIGYGRVFRRSLWVLPFVLLIGVFNPVMDKEEAFRVGGVVVSRGWVSFFSVILRGLLAVQGALLLVSAIGFQRVCRGLRRMHLPSLLVTQLLLTYRYLEVLVEEVGVMRNARKARGYGKESYSLKMWGEFIGQLLLRSISRAERIHLAMQARGFKGVMPSEDAVEDGGVRSAIFTITSLSLFAFLRMFDLSAYILRAGLLPG